jgi:hypothetical protein
MASILGTRVVRHNVAKIRFKEVPSYPYKLTVIMDPPDPFRTGIVTHYQKETLVVQGLTEESLLQMIQELRLVNERTRSCVITDKKKKNNCFEFTREA